MKPTSSHRTFPQSLCHHCTGVKYTQSKAGSLFLMCTRTERRYAQQPLTVCSAFQPSSMVDLEIEHRTTEQIRNNVLTTKFHQHCSSVFETNSLERATSSWQRIHHEDPQRILFQKSSQENSSITFEFEKGHKLPSPQLSPSFCFIIHDQKTIEWSNKPVRSHILGWISTQLSSPPAQQVNVLISQAKVIRFKNSLT